METILGVIFSIIIGFWILGLVGRLFLKYWIVKKQRQMEEQMRNGGASGGFGSSGSFGGGNFRGFYTTFGGGGGRAQQPPQPKPEGEITIEKTEQPKTVNHTIGEYVDFEEVKERE